MVNPVRPKPPEFGGQRRATWSREHGRATFRAVPAAANDNRHRLRLAIGGLLAIAVSAVLAVAAVLLLGN